MDFLHRVSTTMLLVGALVTLFNSPARADDTLYKAFGEKPGLVHITQDLVTNLLADPRTSAYFEGVSLRRLNEKLVEQFCVLTGGPCEYTGRTMKRTHEGLNIDRAAFNALVEDLQKAMDKNNVPFRSQNKLLSKLAPMYRDIEERD